MPYWVWCVYLIVVAEWLVSMKEKKSSKGLYLPQNKFYFIMGIFNILVAAIIGYIIGQCKNLVAPWEYWSVLFGCALLIVRAVFYTYKMMISNH